MNPVLRDRLMRKLEAIPDDQAYQVLDYIEFLESKYAEAELRREATGLQKLGERIEDGLRKRTISPGVLREAFHLISAADKVLSGVATAGKDILGDLNGGDRRSSPTQTGGESAGPSEAIRDEESDVGGSDLRTAGGDPA